MPPAHRDYLLALEKLSTGAVPQHKTSYTVSWSDLTSASQLSGQEVATTGGCPHMHMAAANGSHSGGTTGTDKPSMSSGMKKSVDHRLRLTGDGSTAAGVVRRLCASPGKAALREAYNDTIQALEKFR